MTNLDETELARLEELAGKATPLPWRETTDPSHFYTISTVLGGEKKKSRGLSQQLIVQVGGWANIQEQEANTCYISAACNAVPALVAEVRRLRAEAKQGGIDYCALMDKHDAQFVRAEKLREEVNWLAKTCATHCRDKSFDNAQCSIQDCAPHHCYHASAEQWKEAAREAVHADRE